MDLKQRRDFLMNAPIHSVKKYFKLLSRVGSKDARYTKQMMRDLKWLNQKGGVECHECTNEEKCEANGCVWNPDLHECRTIDEELANMEELAELEDEFPLDPEMEKLMKEQENIAAALARRANVNNANANLEAELAELKGEEETLKDLHALRNSVNKQIRNWQKPNNTYSNNNKKMMINSLKNQLKNIQNRIKAMS